MCFEGLRTVWSGAIVERSEFGDGFQKCFCHAEGAIRHGVPEVEILVKVVLHARCVADDAETQEGDVVEVADLCQSPAFHIDCQSLGETLFDGLQRCWVGDELVAAADESAVNLRFRCGEFRGDLEEAKAGGEEERQTLHLSGFVFGTAVHVMISHRLSDHHVHHTDRRVNAAGDAGVDDGVQSVVVEQLCRSDGCVHLSDAAFHQNHVTRPILSLHHSERSEFLFFGVGKQLHELFVLFVHGVDEGKGHGCWMGSLRKCIILRSKDRKLFESNSFLLRFVLENLILIARSVVLG